MSVPAQRALRSAIDSRQFEPVYYLHGDDEHRKDDALSQIIAAAVDPACRDFNFDSLRGGDADPERLGVALNSLPMLADRRLVVLRDVGALKKAARAELDRYLDAPAQETVLVLTSPAGEKPDAEIARRAESIAFPPLAGDALIVWLRQQSLKMGAELSEESANLLATVLDNDLSHAVGELDKLASYTNGRAITPADIEAVVGVRRGETTVDLLNAVAARDGARAAALVAPVLAQPKTSGVQLVILLSVQFVAMAWGRAARDAGLNASRLEAEFFSLLKAGRGYPGRPWSDAAKCWARNLPKWDSAALAHAIEQLRIADTSLKDTRVSSDEAIIASLVLSLCAPARRSAA